MAKTFVVDFYHMTNSYNTQDQFEYRYNNMFVKYEQ